MDIKVTSTGNIWRRIDDGVGLMLIDALPSVFERAKAPAPAPPPTHPVFCLSAGAQGRAGISCTYPSGESRLLIHADGFALPTREAAADYLGNTVWDGTEGKHVKKPLPVPDAIWKQFLLLYGGKG